MQNFKYFTEAKMARQHFQLIADIISKLDISTVIKKEVASAFADGLEATNPMFKRDAFMKATKMKNKGIPTSGGKYDKHMFPFGQDGKKKK